MTNTKGDSPMSNRVCLEIEVEDLEELKQYVKTVYPDEIPEDLPPQELAQFVAGEDAMAAVRGFDNGVHCEAYVISYKASPEKELA